MHEIDNVYICGNGKKFLDYKEAQTYQRKLEIKEEKKLLQLTISSKEMELKRLKRHSEEIDKVKLK